MASFTERVQVLIDVTADKAGASLSGLKGKVGEAEGAFGKLKAGASGAMDIVGENLGLSAGALATAAVAFGTKAVGAFQELALTAGDLAVKMGMSTEEASRWMEVSGDLGVNVDAVAKAAGRLNTAAGQGKLAQYGIDADTANGRLLQTIEMLAGIEDPAARAAKGAELLGKKWTELAPLVEQSTELRDRLGEVSSQKVITSSELSNARDFRDSMDLLADTADDLTLTVGQNLVPALNTLLESIAPVIEAIDKASGLTVPFTENLDLMGASIGVATTPFRVMGDAFSLWSGGADDATDSTDNLTDAVDEAGQPVDDLTESVDDLNEKLDDLATKMLSGEEASLHLRKSTIELQYSLMDAGADTDTLKNKVIDFAQELVKNRGTPAAIESLRAMKAYVAPGSEMDRYLDNIIGQLDDIEGTHSSTVTVDTRQAQAQLQALIDKYGVWARMLANPFVAKGPSSASVGAAGVAAAPAPDDGGGAATVGLRAGSPPGALPTAATSRRAGAGVGGTTVIYNAPPGTPPADVVRAIRTWETNVGTVAMGATGL